MCVCMFVFVFASVSESVSVSVSVRVGEGGAVLSCVSVRAWSVLEGWRDFVCVFMFVFVLLCYWVRSKRRGICLSPISLVVWSSSVQASSKAGSEGL